MKKVLLVLAVAAFAVACGNTGQQGTAQGQATEVRAAGCCSDGPTCCSEGLTREECAERKERKAAQGCRRAAGEECKRGTEGCQKN